jgi:flagellar basal-body rod modification protein FlgD
MADNSISNITDTVKTQVESDKYGNKYSTAVSNDKLTNEDFLNLLLTEMKMQDPTKPMDSDKMLQNQMDMSTIDANTKMSESMKSLEKAFVQSNISTSANMIGKVVQKGISEDGETYQYLVSSVEQKNGEIVLNGKQLTGKDSDGNYLFSDANTLIQYNEVTKIMKGI